MNKTRVLNNFIEKIFDEIDLELIFTSKKKHLRVSRRMVDILSINYQLNDIQMNNNLGWVPKTTMSEGLENTFKWLDNQKNHQ